MSITVSTSPSRTTGFAPLYVNFDHSYTRSTIEDTVDKAFKNLTYITTFGDVGVGASTWQYGNTFVNSRNEALGAGIAAHVYETPGTYSMTLKVFDPNDSALASTTISITVSDPELDASFTSSNCIVVSTSGVFTGAPAGATQVTTSDLSTAFGNLTGTKKRILFRRGHTFSDTTPTVITQAGRVIVGTFASDGVPGTGAKPILTSSASDRTLSITTSDISFQDLEVRNTGGGNAIENGGVWSKVTFLRIDVTDGDGGGILSNEYSGSTAVHSEIAVVECSISGVGGGYCSYFAAEKAAFLGCQLLGENSSVGNFRTQYFTRSVMQNCTLTEAGAGFHLVKHGAPKRTSQQAPPYETLYSELSAMQDNYFDNRDGLNSNNWIVAIGTENAAQDERVRFTVYERNWVRASNDEVNTIGYLGMTSSSLFRNNLADMTNGYSIDSAQVAGVAIFRRGIEPVPDGNEIYNNTVWRADASVTSILELVNFFDGTGGFARNNIGYSSSNAGRVDAIVDADSNTASNNSNDGNMASTNPGTWSGPVNPIDFVITTTSPYDGAGFAVKNPLDYFGRSRVGVSNDMGFYQLVEGTYPWEDSTTSPAVGIARGCASMFPRFR